MRVPFKASSRVAAPLVLATAGLAFLALHCSTDDGTASPFGSSGTTATSGSGGSLPQSGSPSGGMTTAGGSSAGTSSGGVSGGGAAGTFSAAGSGGSGGAGGSAGSSGAAGSSGSGGGGGGGVTFAQVKELLSKSCAGMKCHNPESDQIDWTTSDGLYMRLTSPIPNGIPHCVGNTPVMPGMPDQSLMIQALKGKPTCNKVGGGTEMIGRMPDNCSTTGTDPRACLKDDQIKLISDWIAAGAPM